MKKIALTAIVIFAFLVSIVAGVQVLEVAKAYNAPSDIPVISVLSPNQNQTYRAGNIWLNFTVSKPANWTEPWIGNPYVSVNLGSITFVSFTLDGTESDNITVNDASVYTIPQDLHMITPFSINLTGLSSGQHSLKVTAYGLVYVSGGTTKDLSEPFSPVVTAPVVAHSPIINFTVVSFVDYSPSPSTSFTPSPTQQPTLQPTQTASPTSPPPLGDLGHNAFPLFLGIIIVVAIVSVASVMVYFKKHHK